MRVLQLASHLGQEANGVAPVVVGIANELSVRGEYVTVACLGLPNGLEGVNLFSAKVSGGPKRLELSWGLAYFLWKNRRAFDVVHNHGLWSMINIIVGSLVPNRITLLVTSPHGTLSAWAMGRSKKVKSLVWPLQRLALTRADLIHVTSREEYEAVRHQGFKAPVAIIPNGVNIPPMIPSLRARQQKTLLFLGRIHPVKGLENLIAAWSIIQGEFQDWDLRVAGVGDDSYVKSLKQHVKDNIVERVTFVGPVYGQEKSEEFFSADLFILPSFSENFAVAVAEALAHGCPAIVGRGAPWSGLSSMGCGWWVDNDVDTLVATLKTALSTDRAILKDMGKAGRKWMADSYGWTAIVEKFARSYEWVKFRDQLPDFIKID